jgi:glycosyltransferase involved in cell wall biosynthesis
MDHNEIIEKKIKDSYEIENNVLIAVPNPVVSIRTSTYQHVNYIKQCIEGVLMQKTNFSFEYIIGEDYSTDGTREIVLEYAKKYPNIIRVITADYNVGAKANGRRCKEVLRGKYIALCEGDDYWTDPYKLQKQVDVLEANPQYSMCFHDAYIIWEGKKKRRKFCQYNKAVYNTIDLIEKKWFIPTQSIVYRVDKFEHKEWMNYVYGGDYALQLALSTKGDIAYIDKIMSVYRKNYGSINAKIKPNYSALRLIETLSLFNYDSCFKYDANIKKRIEFLRGDLYYHFLCFRPKYIRFFNVDYILSSIILLLSRWKK